MTPAGETINEMKRKENAFRLLMQIAVSPEREASQAEVVEIMTYLPNVLRGKMGLWFSCLTPADVIDFAESERECFSPTYDQAKGICHDLEGYEHLYSEVNEAVRNELRTLRNGGVWEWATSL